MGSQRLNKYVTGWENEATGASPRVSRTWNAGVRKRDHEGKEHGFAGANFGSNFWNHFGSKSWNRLWLTRPRKINPWGPILVPFFRTILVPNFGTQTGSRLLNLDSGPHKLEPKWFLKLEPKLFPAGWFSWTAWAENGSEIQNQNGTKNWNRNCTTRVDFPEPRASKIIPNSGTEMVPELIPAGPLSHSLRAQFPTPCGCIFAVYFQAPRARFRGVLLLAA